MTTRKTYLRKVAFSFTLSLLFVIMVMSTACATHNIGIGIQDEPYRIETFTVDTPGELDVNTSGGFITVEGSSSNTVRVEMYVRKNGRNYLPEDTNIEDWDIDISQSANRVKANAKHKGNWSFFNNRDNYSISFVVYAPKEMSANLNTSGGHIKVKGLTGNQEISTSGGHLDLADLKGNVEARTSGGHISLADVQGNVEARTSGGHISVENAEGKLRVKTSGGHIDLENVRGSIEAKTSGGSITADLKSIDQFVDLRTSGGSINISVPANVGLDLDLKGSYVSTRLKNFSGQVDRDEVAGKLNGGGPKMSARTSGGTVSLSFQ